MLVRRRLGAEVPALTAQAARVGNLADTTAVWVRDRLDGLWDDEDFAGWYPRDERPGISSAQLATVSVLQFLLGLSGRDAAGAVRCRIGFRYALGLDLDDPGFGQDRLHHLRRRQAHRGLPPRELYDPQLRNRVGQQDPAWHKRYAVRSSIEGTVCELANGHDMRHCRYLGQPKIHLQHVLTAIAVNIERLSQQPPGQNTPRGRLRPSRATSTSTASSACAPGEPSANPQRPRSPTDSRILGCAGILYMPDRLIYRSALVLIRLVYQFIVRVLGWLAFLAST